MQLSHEQFQQLVDSGDPVMLALGAHWIALKQIMAPITAVDNAPRSQEAKAEGEELGMIRWLRYLNRSVLDFDSARAAADADASASAGSASDGSAGAGVGAGRNRKATSDRGSWREYIAWPLWVEKQLDDDLEYFGRESQNVQGTEE